MPHGDPPPTEAADFYEYVTGQLAHLHQLTRKQQAEIESIEPQLNSLRQHIRSTQEHVRLVEVYQQENFRNNQRIFHQHPQVEVLSQRVALLEEVNLQPQLQKQEEEDQQLHLVTRKLKELEGEIDRIKSKNHSLSRFKRETSPRNIYCQSTRDISVDHKESQKQGLGTKQLEKRLQDFLATQLKGIEERLNIKQSDRGQDYTHNQPGFNRRTRLKETYSPVVSPRSKAIISHPREEDINSDFEAYYSHPTEKGQNLIPNLVQISTAPHRKKQKKSKSKSNSKRKVLSRSKSKEAVSLQSVGQFLRLKSRRQ